MRLQERVYYSIVHDREMVDLSVCIPDFGTFVGTAPAENLRETRRRFCDAVDDAVHAGAVGPMEIDLGWIAHVRWH